MVWHVGVFILAFLAAFQSTSSQCTNGSLQLDTSVFYTGNGTFAAGLLLVCRDGVWGTVEADTSALFWSEKNALVACRSLGFNGALNTIPATQINQQLRNRAEPVLYRSAACTGVERVLTDCPGITAVEDSSSSHNFDVYLVCWPGSRPYNELHTVILTTSRLGDVRLVGDTMDGRGIVEMFTSAGWTTICPDNTWTNDDAQIVCQSLGYETGRANTYQISSSNQTVISPLLVMDSQCMSKRQASSIFRVDGGFCSFSFVGGENQCLSLGYAGVVCDSKSKDLSMRLFGLDSFSSDNFVGIVEYFLDGRWGVLCAPSAKSSLIPQIICGDLGYHRDKTSYINLSTQQIQIVESRQKPAWLWDYTCSSTVNSFSECSVTRPVGYGRCRGNKILAISCGPRKRPLSSGAIAGIVVPCVFFAVGVILLLVYKDQWVPKFKNSKFYKFFRCGYWSEWKAASSRRLARWRTAREQRRAAREQRRAVRRAEREQRRSNQQPPTNAVAPAPHAADSSASANADSELSKAAPPPYSSASGFPGCSVDAPPPYSVQS